MTFIKTGIYVMPERRITDIAPDWFMDFSVLREYVVADRLAPSLSTYYHPIELWNMGIFIQRLLSQFPYDIVTPMKNIFVIYDRFAGELLIKYNPNDPNSWDWDSDNYLDHNDIASIHPSASFLTLEAATIAKEKIHAQFLKTIPPTELEFEILKVNLK